METLRCFIAIDLPEDLKKTMAEIQRDFCAWPARVKWVEGQNFHLTLKFLGNVARPRLADIETGLGRAAAAHRKFVIPTAGLGAFPNARRPKVIWVGIADPEGALAGLWTSIERELGCRGVVQEDKPFSPHLTLGRVKDLHPAPGFAELLQGLDSGVHVIPVTEIKLMRSQLSRRGPEYSCLRSFSLQ